MGPTLFVHSRKGPGLLRFAGTFWLVATLSATLGFGYHYGADLVAGVVFALTVEVAMRTYDRGWRRPGILVCTRCDRLQPRSSPRTATCRRRWPPIRGCSGRFSSWLATLIAGYVRITERWEPAAVRTPELSPEPV